MLCQKHKVSTRHWLIIYCYRVCYWIAGNSKNIYQYLSTVHKIPKLKILLENICSYGNLCLTPTLYCDSWQNRFFLLLSIKCLVEKKHVSNVKFFCLTKRWAWIDDIVMKKIYAAITLRIFPIKTHFIWEIYASAGKYRAVFLPFLFIFC